MKLKTFSILGAITILGLAGLGLTSCGGTTVENAGEAFELLTLDDLKANSSESDPIVVDFWHSFGHNISDELTPLVDAFEEEMAEQGIHIRVDVTSVGGGYDGLRSRVNLGTKTNNVPTMLLGYPDHFADYIDSGILLDLTPFVESTAEGIGMSGDANADYLVEDFVDSYWNEVEMEDKDGNDIIAGIPFNKSTEIMYYNASAVDPILEEHGWLDEETGYWLNPTWEQLATVSEELIAKVRAGTMSWVYNGATYNATKTNYPTYIDSGSNWFITMLKQYCETQEEANDVYTNAKGEVVFSNQTTIDALTYFYDYTTQGRTGSSSNDVYGVWNLPNAVNQSYGSYMMNNLDAFISVGSTAGVNNNNSDKYELKCTTYPQVSYDGSNVNAVIQQGTNAAILSSNSNNLTRLAAWLLIRYLTNTENTTEFSMSTGYLAVRESAVNSSTYQNFLANEDNPFTGTVAKAINATNRERQYFTTDPAFSGSSMVRDNVDTMMVSIMCQGADFTSAISKCYSDLEDFGITCIDRLS